MRWWGWQYTHPKYWLGWIGIFLMWSLVWMPRPIQRAVGYVISLLLKPIMKRRIAIADKNLALCFPEWSDEERATVLAENHRTSGWMIVETALSWWGTAKQLQKRVDYKGLEHLEAALARGKGVILLTGHFSSMEIGGRLVGLEQAMYVMFRPMKSPLFNAVMTAARTRHCEGIVLQKEPRQMLKALRKNKMVWYAPDQDFGEKNSIYATFFGQTAISLLATSKVAAITGAAVVPFVPRREKNGHYTITIHPVFEGFPSGDEAADVQRVNDFIEQAIRQAPAQYYWVHRRFKTQPEGHGLLYK